MGHVMVIRPIQSSEKYSSTVNVQVSYRMDGYGIMAFGARR